MAQMTTPQAHPGKAQDRSAQCATTEVGRIPSVGPMMLAWPDYPTPFRKRKSDLRGGRLGLDEYLRRLIH